jgi:hypothetical protein
LISAMIQCPLDALATYAMITIVSEVINPRLHSHGYTRLGSNSRVCGRICDINYIGIISCR